MISMRIKLFALNSMEKKCMNMSKAQVNYDRFAETVIS